MRSVIQLPLDSEEFGALLACALGFVMLRHPLASEIEKYEATVEGVQSFQRLGAEQWEALIDRANNLARVAWPERFSITKADY